MRITKPVLPIGIRHRGRLTAGAERKYLPGTSTPAQTQDSTRAPSAPTWEAGRRPVSRQLFCKPPVLLAELSPAFGQPTGPRRRVPQRRPPPGQGQRSAPPVDYKTWLDLLREQLRWTLDGGVVRVGKQGARGVVFQVPSCHQGFAANRACELARRG